MARRPSNGVTQSPACRAERIEKTHGDFLIVNAEGDRKPVEAGRIELEDALGHRFAEPALLVRALTHRSLANQKAQESAGKEISALEDNERLEFLGDAVLGLVVGEILFRLHPDWQEGELTRVRAQLVSRDHMAEVANRIQLGSHLLLSRGEDRSGLRRKSTVLSNAMEAVIGALFLDAGLDPVRWFVRARVMGETADQLAEQLRSGQALGNFKSALQEHLQSTHAGTPIYVLKSESGPDHRKRFLVEVHLRPAGGEAGKLLARGSGGTKKHAEQEAARRALSRMRGAGAEARTHHSAGGEKTGAGKKETR